MKKLLAMTLCAVLCLGLLPVTAGAVSPAATAFDELAYYGDLANCKMTAQQAEAFAQVIEEEAPKYQVCYAALCDFGNGIPVLYLFGGADESWASEDSVSEGTYFQYDVVWIYTDGGVQKLFDGSSYIDGQTSVGPNGILGESYGNGAGICEVYPVSDGAVDPGRCVYGGYDVHTDISFSFDNRDLTEEQYEAELEPYRSQSWAGRSGGNMYPGAGRGGNFANKILAALRKYADLAFTAYASTQTVELDGKQAEFQCYALKDVASNPTNYIKLRDLAVLLNGSAAQFEVGYDGAVNIETGKAYTPNGSEGSTPFSGDRAYQDSTALTKVDGKTADLSAIVLTDDNGGGYTYYKLRDLGRALGFNVGWSAERGVFLETNKPYDAND